MATDEQHVTLHSQQPQLEASETKGHALDSQQEHLRADLSRTLCTPLYLPTSNALKAHPHEVFSNHYPPDRRCSLHQLFPQSDHQPPLHIDHRPSSPTSLKRALETALSGTSQPWGGRRNTFPFINPIPQMPYSSSQENDDQEDESTDSRARSNSVCSCSLRSSSLSSSETASPILSPTTSLPLPRALQTQGQTICSENRDPGDVSHNCVQDSDRRDELAGHVTEGDHHKHKKDDKHVRFYLPSSPEESDSNETDTVSTSLPSHYNHNHVTFDSVPHTAPPKGTQSYVTHIPYGRRHSHSALDTHFRQLYGLRMNGHHSSHNHHPVSHLPYNHSFPKLQDYNNHYPQMPKPLHLGTSFLTALNGLSVFYGPRLSSVSFAPIGRHFLDVQQKANQISCKDVGGAREAGLVPVGLGCLLMGHQEGQCPEPHSACNLLLQHCQCSLPTVTGTFLDVYTDFLLFCNAVTSAMNSQHHATTPQTSCNCCSQK